MAIAITYWTFEHFGPRNAIVIAWSVGFSHYLVGILYSRKQITHVLSQPSSRVPLLLLGLGGLGMYLNNFSLFLYFGLHHALNESYLGLRYQSSSLTEQNRKQLRAAGFIAHLSGYLLIIYTATLFGRPILLTVTGGIFIGSLIFYFHIIWKQRNGFSVKEFISSVFIEFVLILLVIVDLSVYNIQLYQIVLYHFVFWAIFPASNLLLRNQLKDLGLYLALTVITLFGFIAYSPVYTNSWFSGYYDYKYWFIIFSFVHITSSFAISGANPGWIRTIFNKTSAESRA